LVKKIVKKFKQIIFVVVVKATSYIKLIKRYMGEFMSNTKKQVVTRMAPSPTSVFKTDENGELVGGMHVGNLRNALYSYIYAKKNNGKFILRIEDTDQKRSNKESLNDILNTLNNFNISWDEYYVQSERINLYKYYAYKLLCEGVAYVCTCENSEDGCTCKEKHIHPIGKFCIKLDVGRFKDGKCIHLKDEIRKSPIEYPYESMYDIVLLKSDGLPTYHLASVVDDTLMGITHVFRSDEWIPSFPYHVCLYKAFNWDLPKFYHLPLLTNMEGSKLSKRDGDLSVNALLRSGILPSSIINYVTLLGWRPKGNNEIFTFKELIDLFNVDGFKTRSCCYDIKKLKSMNLKHSRTDYGREEFKTIFNVSNKVLVERYYELYTKGIDVFQIFKMLKNININFDIDENFSKEFKKLIIKNKENLNKETLESERVSQLLEELSLLGFSKKEINENIRLMITGNSVGLPANNLLELIDFRKFYMEDTENEKETSKTKGF